jgi:hypothetical protein
MALVGAVARVAVRVVVVTLLKVRTFASFRNR